MRYRLTIHAIFSASSCRHLSGETMRCGVNMAGARVIHMNTIRAARDVELAKEDINMLRAIEAGDTSAQSAVAAKKQTLRDLPATFSLDGYADPVSLKAAWPSELPAKE